MIEVKIVPLIILALINAFGLGLEAAKHGQKKDQKYCIWNSLIGSGLQWVLIVWAFFL